MIKNEMGKIDILIHQMRHLVQNQMDAREPTATELKEMLGMAADSVQQFQTMMTKINEQRRTIHLNVAKQNLLPIVEQCLAIFEKTVSKPIAIKRSFEPVPDVDVDSLHMKEVICNILDNAAEAVEDGGEIKVSLKETRHEVAKNRKDNFGLGLYYRKNVMERHHGSIHVESTPGKGTSFYLKLKK